VLQWDMPHFWLTYGDANRVIGAIIIEAPSMPQARTDAPASGLDAGAPFAEGHPLSAKLMASVPPAAASCRALSLPQDRIRNHKANMKVCRRRELGIALRRLPSRSGPSLRMASGAGARSFPTVFFVADLPQDWRFAMGCPADLRKVRRTPKFRPAEFTNGPRGREIS
jgi:hypothetical protein